MKKIFKKLYLSNLLFILIFLYLYIIKKNKKINIAVYYDNIKNGGAQRITVLLINKSIFKNFVNYIILIQFY